MNIICYDNSLPSRAAAAGDGRCILRLLAAIVLTAATLFASQHAINAAELLSNGNFATTSLSVNGSEIASHWTPYGSGYTLDTGAKHNNSPSILCVSAADSETHGACFTLIVNQSKATPLSVSGWSRAENVDGEADSDYSIYADITYQDGSPLWGQNVAFGTGTHNWQIRRLIIDPIKPIRSINLYALFRNHSGKVWFTDFSVQDAVDGASFDSQAVTAPVLPPGATTDWFVRDVGDDTELTAISPKHDALGVEITGFVSPHPGKPDLMTVRNRLSRNRALTIYFVERYSPNHPVWYDDIRSSRRVDGSSEYANLTAVNVGATGQMSLYPFGCVTGDNSGRALAVPLNLGPRIDRIVYDSRTHLFFVAFDLDLAPENSSPHSAATIGVVSYSADPKWGFRDTAATYYSIFPQDFNTRTVARGIWMPFTDPSTIDHPGDFHFGYHEGNNSVAFDRANGILSFTYVEPMTFWMSMPASTPRTYQSALSYLDQLAQQTKDTNAQHSALAALNSCSTDANGRFNVSFRNTPWCDGAVWTLNPNPDLPHSNGAWIKATLNEDAEPKPGVPNQPDGEYLDSLEMMADVLDYRPESLSAAQMPLIFANGDPRPVIPTWYSVYEAAAGLSSSLHAHGNLLMANTALWRFGVFAPLLDVMGTETNMFDQNGKWSPDTDAIMNFRRTLTYHKPYLLLMNTDFTKVGIDGIEKYFQRCLFYDILPSMFSVDAADNPYWQTPSLYNRDRPLFEKYIPLIQQLSKSGWQPITYASASNNGLCIERYGDNLFTVMNPTDSTISASISFDSRYLKSGFTKATKLAVFDEIQNQQIGDLTVGETNSVSLNLSPSQTHLLRLGGSQ